jgi:hypothetical protein
MYVSCNMCVCFCNMYVLTFSVFCFVVILLFCVILMFCSSFVVIVLLFCVFLFLSVLV